MRGVVNEGFYCTVHILNIGTDRAALCSMDTRMDFRPRTMSTVDDKYRQDLCRCLLVGTSVKTHADQEAFLSNTGNKTQLIKMLSSRLQSLGHVTKINEGGADTLIVSTAMDYANGGQAAGWGY